MSNFILSHQQQDQIYQLYLYAFNAQDSAQRKNFWNDRFQHSIPYGISNNGQIETGVLSIPFSVNFFGKTFKMNGISDVMSAPEASGKGGASQLMTAALNDMYANGTTLSYLAPFAFGYYRRFGYEQIFDHIRYSIPSDKLPRISGNPSIKIKRMDFDAGIDLIKPIYEQSELATHGGLKREDWWWHYLPKKFSTRKLAVAFTEQQPTGYIIYERSTTNFIIHEIASLNNDSRTALWKFVTKHGTTAETFVYNSSSSNSKLDLIDEPWNVSSQINPYMMARIVNLENFLTNYPTPIHDLNFTFDITDETIFENTGRWNVQVTNQMVKVTKITSKIDSKNALTIQALTKVLFGYRSLASQAQFGKVPNVGAELIQKLDSFAIKGTPILADYF